MREAEHSKGIDALLFDGVPNNLDNAGENTMVRPPGFVGFQEPMPPPEYKPFNYPVGKFLKLAVFYQYGNSFTAKN